MFLLQSAEQNRFCFDVINFCLNFQVAAAHRRKKMETWTVTLVAVLTLAALHPVAPTSHIKVTKHASYVKCGGKRCQRSRETSP